MLRSQMLCHARTSVQIVCLCFVVNAVSAAGQVAEPAEPMEHAQHSQHDHHHLHLPMGEEKCAPTFT